MSRVTNDVDAVSGALQQAFIGIVNAILGITLAAAMMFYPADDGADLYDHDSNIDLDLKTSDQCFAEIFSKHAEFSW